MTLDMQLLPDHITHSVCYHSPTIITQAFLSQCKNYVIPNFSKLVDNQIFIFQDLSSLSSATSPSSSLSSQLTDFADFTDFGIAHKLRIISLAHDIQESVLTTRDLIKSPLNNSPLSVYHYKIPTATPISKSVAIKSVSDSVPLSSPPPPTSSSLSPSSSFTSSSSSSSPSTKDISMLETEIVKELIEYSDNGFDVSKELRSLQSRVQNTLELIVNLIALSIKHLGTIRENNFNPQQCQKLKEMLKMGVGEEVISNVIKDVSSKNDKNDTPYNDEKDGKNDLNSDDIYKFQGKQLSSRQYRQIRDIYKILLRTTNENLRNLYSEAITAYDG